ncbi:MAG TPA: hypothetical protein VMO88_05045, partial [Acidimicrobiales bacterium]|nr:hypothetical protein [Acidimicrobiales bacterium]
MSTASVPTRSAGEPTDQLWTVGEQEDKGGWRNAWRKGWTRKRFVSLAAIALLVGGAVLGTWLATSGGSSAASPITVTTQKVTVSTGTIKRTVSTSGTIVP